MTSLHQAGLILALARIGGYPCVLIAQDRHGPPPGPAALRQARRGARLATGLRVPVVCVIDTPGAELSARAEEDGLASEIAHCLADLITLPVPTVSLLLGQGAGGAALALLPAGRFCRDLGHALHRALEDLANQDDDTRLAGRLRRYRLGTSPHRRPLPAATTWQRLRRRSPYGWPAAARATSGNLAPVRPGRTQGTPGLQFVNVFNLGGDWAHVPARARRPRSRPAHWCTRRPAPRRHARPDRPVRRSMTGRKPG